MISDPGEPQQDRRRSGINWLDLVIAMTALLISSTSLIVAIVHSRTLERMADANARLVEANSWPYVSYSTTNKLKSFNDPEDEIALNLENDGVGPAKIEAVEVSWNGIPQHTFVDLLKACCQPLPRSLSLEGNFPISILRAGQSLMLIGLIKNNSNASVFSALDNARVSRALAVTVCYCSVFNECWKTNSRQVSLTPARVDRCEVPRVPYIALPPK